MMTPTVVNSMPSSLPSTSTRLNDLPTDTRLPQLPIILDEAIMREKLQHHMFASDSEQTQFSVRQCEILQVRYKPGSSCMVSYRLDIVNTSTGESSEQILCGRAVPEGRSQSKREKAEAHALVQPRFGKPLLHLPDIEMILWSFPNDRKMRTLPAVIAKAQQAPEFLPNWLTAHRGPEWHVVGTTSNVVHYVGEHTCTVRTSIDLVNTAQRTHQTMIIFGKTYYDEEGAETERVMRHLWDSASRRNGRLGLAQPLWHDMQRKTLWQLGIQGSTLEAYAIENSESISLFTEAARAIAIFHATPLPSLRSVTIPNLIDTLGAVGSMLMQCRPSCRPVLAPLLARLTAQGKMVPASPTATLHGDLHLKNLFLTDGKIALIDLDNVCEGPPAWDIGSFVAGLLAGALARHVSHDRMASHIQAFLCDYNQSAPWRLDVPTVVWCTAVALVLERSHRCITRLKPGHRGQLDALISLADQLSKSLSWDPLANRMTGVHERSARS